MTSLSVITVFKIGQLFELENTVSSVRSQTVPPHEHILVVSGVNNPVDFEIKFANNFTKLIINKDLSIYNAMNIGLARSTGDALIFLNGGDCFVDCTSIEKIIKNYVSGRCLAMRAVQVYADDFYVRPALRRLSDLKKWPNHQAFIAAGVPARQVKFDELKTISSDMEWMRGLIDRCGVKLNHEVISKFALGGISNMPTISTTKARLLEGGYFQAFLEFVKFIIRVLFGKKNYYRIVLSYKNDKSY